MNKKIIDCRSEEGITIGLIDSLISIARILSKRDLNESKNIKEALLDLRSDEDVALIMQTKEIPTSDNLNEIINFEFTVTEYSIGDWCDKGKVVGTIEAKSKEDARNKWKALRGISDYEISFYSFN